VIRIKLSNKLLEKLLRFTDDMKIEWVSYDGPTIYLLVSSPALPEVEDGMTVPERDVVVNVTTHPIDRDYIKSDVRLLGEDDE